MGPYSRLLFLLFFVVIPGMASAQRDAEVGVFAGMSYYKGDINPSHEFYSPLPSAGLLYRYNFNPRYAIRVGAIYGQLHANDQDFNNLFQQKRNQSFKASLIDLSVMPEFNFLPLKKKRQKISYTTYVTAGIAVDYPLSSTYPLSNYYTFPFGVGGKFLITENVTLGLEWTFRKTFDDHIDGIQNSQDASKTQSFIHHNDWYSFFGVSFTYKFFNGIRQCPAYGNAKSISGL
ncbi:MAG: DUF6089 family protein [Bacteroidota bacterium]|nr:DUF6089 family protein [Bacteroidota bacterium]